MTGFTGFGGNGNSIGGDSQFGKMGSNDPYGSGNNNSAGSNSGHNGSDHSGNTSDHSANTSGSSNDKASALAIFAKLTGTKTSEISNFRSDGEGGWTGSIGGKDVHAFADEMYGYNTPNPNGGSSQSGSNNTSNSAAGNNSVQVSSTWDRTAKYYSSSDQVSRKALKNMYEKAVKTGVIPNEARGSLRQKVQAMLDEDKRLAAEAAKKTQDEKELLTKTSEIIVSVGGEVGKYLGVKYTKLANEIAGNIRNFQGKTIRSYVDAMKTLNKITSNPSLKISSADRVALENAWKKVNAQDMAKKLANLSKAFTVADWAMKVEKVRQKSIEGYTTGNWGPLVLEVESWVLGGMASALALGVFSATIGSLLLSLGIPAVTVGIAGILLAALVGSLIDDSFADKLNNEVIRPAK